MKSARYWFFGCLALLLALFLGVREFTRDSLFHHSGEGGAFFSSQSRFKEEGLAPKKSQNKGSGTVTSSNPVVGDDWQDLLLLIPPRPILAEVSYTAGEVPDCFEQECWFLARIWGKRLGLSPLQTALLTKRLRLKREENWHLMLDKATEISADGKTYLIGSSSDFAQELWPQYWIGKMWPLLESYQEGREPDSGGRELSLFKTSLEVKCPPEMLASFFGEKETSINDEPTKVSGLLREDEVLLWFWIAPELGLAVQDPPYNSNTTTESH